MSKEIPLSEINADAKFSPRHNQGTDKDVVEQYMECFDQLPPVAVFKIEGEKKYLLVDGWHRYGAAKRLNLDSINADVKYGTLKDAMEFAFLANIRHGLPLTREDKSWVLEQFLILHPERSNAWIARDIGVSTFTVIAARERLEAGFQIETLSELVGRDGKTYPRNITQPSLPEPDDAEPEPEEEPVEEEPEPELVPSLGPYVLNDVHQSDSIKALMALPEASIHLVFADPPYNIGIKYGDNGNDRLPDAEYHRWCAQWFQAVWRVLAPGGAFYVMHYPEVAAQWKQHLDQMLTFRRWITWAYPSNVGHSSSNWTRAQRTILYYTKGQPAYFDGAADPQPYKNPNDLRIKHLPTDGTTPYDWWEYNLVKNVSTDKTAWPNQIPSDLVYRIVVSSCPPDGIVLDPFMGSGTTAEAAVRAQRTWLGFDAQERACEITRSRIKDAQTTVDRAAGQLPIMV